METFLAEPSTGSPLDKEQHNTCETWILRMMSLLYPIIHCNELSENISGILREILITNILVFQLIWMSTVKNSI